MENFEQTLDYYIDEPIKECVAFLNLLGFKTRWSCCGFNYKNQLSIKSHVINKPHICLTYVTSTGLNLLANIAIKSGWDLKLAQVSCDVCWEISWSRSLNKNWDDKNSIHNYESSIIGITNLRNTLLSFKEYFLENDIIIEDENIRMKDLMPDWQFPLALPWVINKKDFKLDNKVSTTSIQNESIFEHIKI